MALQTEQEDSGTEKGHCNQNKADIGTEDSHWGQGQKKGKSESIMYIPENSLSCLATNADYAE